jgi:signal transduction histidine kinase
LFKACLNGSGIFVKCPKRLIMNWLKKSLDSLVNLGTDTTVDIHAKYRIRFVNKMITIGILSLWFFTFVHTLQGAYLLSSGLFATSLWLIFCLNLNKHGLCNCAPMFALIGASLIIFFSGYYFVGELCIQYILLSLTPLPALCIDNREKYKIAFTTIFIPSLGTISVLTDMGKVGMFSLPPAQHELYVLLCFLQSIVLIVAQGFLFLHEMEKRYNVYINHQTKIESQTRLSDLGLMTAGIAHEINNPLAVINGAAFVLMKKLDKGKATEEAIRKELNSILDQSDRIIKIIKGLKFVSRDGSNDNFDLFYLNDVVAEAVSLCEPKLNTNHVELVLNSAESDCFANIRVVQIQQVVLSIVSNAIDALEGIEKKKIEVSVNCNEIDFIQIIIQDNGPGIPDHLRQQILKPFLTTKPVGKGTGLGLSVASEILEKHGGYLEIGQPEQGACFILKIPKAKAQKKAA